MNKMTGIVCGVVVALFLGTMAWAGQIINVDFQPGPTGDDSSVNYGGQGVLPDPLNDIWNVVAPGTGGEFNGEYGTGGFYNFEGASFILSNLVDSTGAPTPVTVTVNKAPLGNPAESERAFAIASNNLNSMANIATDALGLMSDYLITRNDGFDDNLVMISNLVTNGIYNLVLFGAGDFGDRNTTFIVGGIAKTTVGVPEGPHTLTEGQDYVVINGVVAEDGTIVITYLNGGENAEGNFNGFQLQAADPVNISTVKVSAVTGLSFQSTTGATYRLQYTGDLLATNGSQTAPFLLSGNGAEPVAFDPPRYSTSKMYRIYQQ